jgi:hypothetical protein
MSCQKKIKPTIILSFIALLITLNSQAEEQYKKFSLGRLIFIEKNLAIEVEVATTKMQRTIGLMFREYLAPNKGMLFVFDDEEIQRVWMRNTLIPLDIIFVSEVGKIVSIIKNIQPCIKEPCVIYDSIQNVKYMLEVNAGFVEKHGIGIAKKIQIVRF